MASDKTKRLLNKTLKQQPVFVAPIASNMVLPNHSGDVRTPTKGGDLANKAYVDSMSGGSPEGTAVKSTGVADGLVLTAVGDGTSAWEAVAGSGDMTKAVYDTDDDGYVDGSQEVVLHIRNDSGGTLSAGTPVYITGYNSGLNLVTVDAADADGAGTMPAVGLILEDVANNTSGYIIQVGSLVNIDTSGWSVGDELWVSTTAGTLTNTKPTGSAAIQKVAQVLRSRLLGD